MASAGSARRFAAATVSIVRDRQSYDLCKAFGVASQTTFTVDIVMCLRELLGVYPSGRRLVDGPYIVVALRSDPNVYKQYIVDEPRLRSLATALDAIVSRHAFKIVFLPFYDGPENDNVIHRKIAGMMQQRDAVIVRDWTMDVQEPVDIVSGAETTVAMRLHAAILALALGRDSRCCRYHRKVRELCSEMRLQHIVEAVMLDDPEAVASAIENSIGGEWSRKGHFPSCDQTTLTSSRNRRQGAAQSRGMHGYKPKSLLAQAGWLMIARVTGFAFTFLIPIVLSRVLDLKQFGLYKQAFLVVATSQSILPLGFGMSTFYFLSRSMTVTNACQSQVMRCCFTFSWQRWQRLPCSSRPGILVLIFGSADFQSATQPKSPAYCFCRSLRT